MTASRHDRNVYEEVTAKIIAELEAGRAPWAQPWESAAAPVGMPTNAATGRAYSGVNILILWTAAIEGGFASHSWLTFKQALTLGGCVRKGERGVTVCYADRFIPEAERERARCDGGDPRAVPFLKRFTVFHLSQCDGLPEHLFDRPAPVAETDIDAAERVIAATRADIRVGGPDAFYAPGPDFIQLQPRAAFCEPVNFYRTAFHELGHWTGHRSRLDRDLSGRFGSPAYGREELVAEMASAFLCAGLAIAPTVRNADYLGHWIELLREDSRAVVRAASAASKAADFIRAFANAEPTASAS